jgi:hypothetical protein
MGACSKRDYNVRGRGKQRYKGLQFLAGLTHIDNWRLNGETIQYGVANTVVRARVLMVLTRMRGEGRCMVKRYGAWCYVKCLGIFRWVRR